MHYFFSKQLLCCSKVNIFTLLFSKKVIFFVHLNHSSLMLIKNCKKELFVKLFALKLFLLRCLVLFLLNSYI